MIRNVQVEMSWLTLVRLVVITASLVTERRFVAPTGRLSFSMRLLDCIGNICIYIYHSILGKMFFFAWCGGGFGLFGHPRNGFFGQKTQESGISCIHLPLRSQEVKSLLLAWKLFFFGKPKDFPEQLRAPGSCNKFYKACHRSVFEQGSGLYSSPRNWGPGDEVQSVIPPHPMGVFF